MKDTTGKNITEHEFTKDIGHRTEMQTEDRIQNYKEHLGLLCRHSRKEYCIGCGMTLEFFENITKQIQSDLLKQVIHLAIYTPDEVKEKNLNLDSRTRQALYENAIGYWDCIKNIKKLAEEKEIILN